VAVVTPQRSAPPGLGPEARVARRRRLPARPMWIGDGLLAIGVALAGVAWMVEGFRTLSADHDLSRIITADESIMVGPILVGVVVAVFLAERRWPAVARPALARAHLVDAGYLALFVLIGPLVTLLDTGFAVSFDGHARFLVLQRLGAMPQAVVAVAIVVGMDGMNWVAHAANHRSQTLWRFHALHHSQEDMSVFTTFRTHPLSHVSYLPSLVPALVLASSGTVPALALVAYGAFVTLPHANLRWTFGPLRGTLVSPAYHRLHHANGPVAGRQAVNFGFVLVWWDRLAGCAVQPAGDDPVATGLAGRPVPVEQAGPAAAVPRVVLGQLVQPLRRGPAWDGRS
jgi:sterol desaturase/sphingolipid hydroxylase (fatty acid hydroxylase superfamily)